MSIMDKLPKAPSTPNFANAPVDDFDNFDDLDLDLDSPEEPVTPEPVAQPQAQATPVRKANPRTHANNEDIPVELMDTKGFQTAVEAATRARSLAATYTKLAERNEFPPMDVLQSDDELAAAIQETLIKRAKSFFNTSRNILQATLENGDASDLLESNEVTTIDALYEINKSAK